MTFKFRGKRLLNSNNGNTSISNENIWLYGNLITNFNISENDCSYILEPNTNIINSNHNLLSILEDSKVDSKSVGQFTKLKDKNEQELYEGDIVEVRHLNGQILIGIGVITFKNSRWEIDWINSNTNPSDLRSDLDFIHEKRIINIIDNIYDNKLLLI